jgi:MraZ protein
VGDTGPPKMLFLGSYEYSMDERGRVPIPPRFRDFFVTGIILTQGAPDRCIRAYPASNFEEQARLYMAEPVTKKAGRVMRRQFFSGAYAAELDRQGRVLIPQPLRGYAALDGQVMLVGVGEGIEIWSASAFREALADEEAEFERMQSE